ncbi:Na/Pi cotransporter family protein [Nitratireductor pacificus]|uniref:Na+/Picotransporter n=1 Tax=Nitratireductor pacificus pht-3B TaxID=391937 RepID=K2MEF6_9HYPH|nr:Na/Pi cotransporter family protein [Nitratireductor pacificus]EKF20546.1 Na+/Picotransporter [Nitratireductor pacificus pht-3B]
MTTSLILIELIGAATLLVWAVRMVRTGVERACGSELKDVLRRAGNRRVVSALAGTCLAVLLQSSTAVAMLSAGFVASGFLSVSTGLSLMLGADLGSALVVKLLSFDLSWLTPLLLASGGGLFLKAQGRRLKQIGRILMGIALVLLSLRLIGDATAPLRGSAVLPTITNSLAGDIIMSFIIGAVFTWLVHSSVATILLIASLASQSLIPLELGIPLVVGANVGSGLIAMGLAQGLDAEARRVPVGNFLFRSAGAVILLAVLAQWPHLLDVLGRSTELQLVNLHLAFNGLLLMVALPAVTLVERILLRLLPAPQSRTQDDTGGENRSALDRTTLDNPSLALASATRELLRMGALLEKMLTPLMHIFQTGDQTAIMHSRRTDTQIRQIQSDLKMFLAELTRREMQAADAERSMEVAGIGVNLEHVSSLVANNLLRLAEQKRDQKLVFSKDGMDDITRMHDRVLANLQLALNIIVSDDPDAARQLVCEKDKLRDLERLSRERHMKRLQSSIPASIETSSIHLETIRDLKQINALLTTVAYPILRERGDLLESRLATSADAYA